MKNFTLPLRLLLFSAVLGLLSLGVLEDLEASPGIIALGGVIFWVVVPYLIHYRFQETNLPKGPLT